MQVAQGTNVPALDGDEEDEFIRQYRKENKEVNKTKKTVWNKLSLKEI